MARTFDLGATFSTPIRQHIRSWLVDAALRSDWERTGKHLRDALIDAIGDLDDATTIRVLEEIAALEDAEWEDVPSVEQRSDGPRAMEVGYHG
jgi:hypothetical protein